MEVIQSFHDRINLSITKKIDRDLIDPVDLWKRLTVRESILLIFKKDRHKQFDLFHNRINLSFFRYKKQSIQIALLDLLKRMTVRESIPSIFKKDWPWASRSGQSLKKIDRSNLFFFTIESITRSQKTIDSIKKQMIKFPTLIIVPVVRVGNSIFQSLILDLLIFRSFRS